jgi:hypothetical protein
MNSFNAEIGNRRVTVVLSNQDIEIRDSANRFINDLIDQEVIKDLRERADKFRHRLTRFPPGVRFYAYDEPKGQTFRRRDTLPAVEELDAAGAGPITAELIGHMGRQFANFKLVGLHHDGRVVEFEYIYLNDQLHMYRY